MRRLTPLSEPAKTNTVQTVVPRSRLPVINRKPVRAQDDIPHVSIAANSISALVNNYYRPVK